MSMCICIHFGYKRSAAITSVMCEVISAFQRLIIICQTLLISTEIEKYAPILTWRSLIGQRNTYLCFDSVSLIRVIP